jgi:hypothetical protein
MHMADLSPYRFATPSPVPGIRAIGWLQRGLSEPELTLTDDEKPLVLTIVGRLLRAASANTMRGIHECDLCDHPRWPEVFSDDRGIVTLGCSEIWIPDGAGGIYAAPSLVYHYIEKHGYRPPAVFLAAASAFSLTSWNASNEADQRLDDFFSALNRP